LQQRLHALVVLAGLAGAAVLVRVRGGSLGFELGQQQSSRHRPCRALPHDAGCKAIARLLAALNQ